MDKKLVLLFLVFLLASCSWIPNLGKNEEIYGDKSARVAVLKGDSEIYIDHNLWV